MDQKDLELLQVKATAFDKIAYLEQQLMQAHSTLHAILEKASVKSVEDLMNVLED